MTEVNDMPFEALPVRNNRIEIGGNDETVLPRAERVQNAAGFIARNLGRAKRTLYGAVIAFEIAPASGPVKYATAAAIGLKTGNPLIAAAALGAGTGTLELTAGLATAELLDSPKRPKVFRGVENLLHKVFKNKLRVTPLAEAVVANYVGTPALLLVKQSENPERTRSQNRKHAALVAGLLGVAQTVQGVAIAEGVTNITDPKVIVPSVAAILGIGYAGSKAKNAITNRSNQEV